MSEIIRGLDILETFAPSVRAYISLGHTIEKVEERAVATALRKTRLTMFTNFSPLEKAEVIQYAEWQSERIKNAKL